MRVLFADVRRWWLMRRLQLAVNLWPQRLCQFYVSGNRVTWRFDGEKGRFLLIVADKTRPDEMSKAEVARMLKIVRHAEGRLGWRAPEPSAADLETVREVFP